VASTTVVSNNDVHVSPVRAAPLDIVDVGRCDGQLGTRPVSSLAPLIPSTRFSVASSSAMQSLSRPLHIHMSTVWPCRAVGTRERANVSKGRLLACRRASEVVTDR